MSSSSPSPSRLNRWLYRGRILATAVILLFVLYNTVFFSFYVPFGGPYVHWRPDSRLKIDYPAGESEQFLLAGDEILAIGAQPLIRTRPIYPLPLQTEYEFTIQRDDRIETYAIPVYAPLNEYAYRTFLPTVLLAFAGWLVGAIMLFIATRDNLQALYAGYIFLLSAAVLIGIQGSLEGVPGAWIAGHCLIFILPVAWLYLGLIPRANPLPNYGRFLLACLYGVGGLLAVVAAYEVLILFPGRTSFQEMVGISLYGLSFLLMALGLISCVLILAVRTWRLPRTSYIRQQLTILLLFFAIGVFPTTLLTIIPRALFDIVLLPFPVGIALMIFIPIGYLFVIYRRGFLGLDAFFNRTVFLTILALIVFVFYASGLYLVQRLLQLDASQAVIPATVIFFPTLLLTIYASKPVNEFVQMLIYGRQRPDEGALAQFTMALSANPESDTLTQIVTTLAQMLHVSQVMLLLKNEKGRWMPVTQLGMVDMGAGTIGSIDAFSQPLLRSAVHSVQRLRQIFQPFSWAELLIPVIVRSEQVGVLALARPGVDGYFNAQQVSFLHQAAGVLAVGSENIALFETTRSLARQALAVREQERLVLANRIHDEPLQQISYVTHLLTRLQDEPEAERIIQHEAVLPQAVAQLKLVATNLRQICTGLRPPFWDQGVEMAVREVVGQAQAQYGLEAVVTIVPEIADTAVSENITLSLCRILSEALNNVIKHAPGAAVQVHLACRDEQLVLIVRDNGPGCHLPAASSSYSDLVRQQHFGIVGMVEWARLVNGRLQLQSEPGKGMEINFTVGDGANDLSSSTSPLSASALKEGETYEPITHH